MSNSSMHNEAVRRDYTDYPCAAMLDDYVEEKLWRAYHPASRADGAVSVEGLIAGIEIAPLVIADDMLDLSIAVDRAHEGCVRMTRSLRF